MLTYIPLYTHLFYVSIVFCFFSSTGSTLFAFPVLFTYKRTQIRQQVWRNLQKWNMAIIVPELALWHILWQVFFCWDNLCASSADLHFFCWPAFLINWWNHNSEYANAYSRSLPPDRFILDFREQYYTQVLPDAHNTFWPHPLYDFSAF